MDRPRCRIESSMPSSIGSVVSHSVRSRGPD
jgi:hypothetical protein